MRPAPAAKQGATRTEQIILFRVGGQLFAVSSASVQEVRSADSLGGSTAELSQPGLRKVRHVVRRGGETVYVINGAMHTNSAADRWDRENDHDDPTASAAESVLP
jgi:hypothetical protein